MKLGIVGHEARKFTPQTEAAAKLAITGAICLYKPELVISGECPLGGIDIWAKEIAKALNIPFQPYPPKHNSWAKGYKPRNLQIANNSDLVLVIAVRSLPATYTGMRFAECYHCRNHGADGTNHIKGGGCWTAWKCKQRAWIFI